MPVASLRGIFLSYRRADAAPYARLLQVQLSERFEIQTALERRVRVIPVLVDGAVPLREEQLPAELHRLARYKPSN